MDGEVRKANELCDAGELAVAEGYCLFVKSIYTYQELLYALLAMLTTNDINKSYVKTFEKCSAIVAELENLGISQKKFHDVAFELTNAILSFAPPYNVLVMNKQDSFFELYEFALENEIADGVVVEVTSKDEIPCFHEERVKYYFTRNNKTFYNVNGEEVG